jgi:hypothetical protein
VAVQDFGDDDGGRDEQILLAVLIICSGCTALWAIWLLLH